MLGITTTNARVGGFRGLGKIAKLILAYFARVIAAGGVTEGRICLSNSLSSLDSKQLLDNASLVLIPSGYEENILFSQVPTSGLGDLSVVRATTATRVNSAGLIELVPRNLLTYSEEFSNANWNKTNTTITANSINSPIGTLTADTFTTSNVTSVIDQNVTFTNPSTISIYVKYIDSQFIQLYTGLSSQTRANFDILNGVLGSRGTDTSISTIESLANGWFRISATFINNSGASNIRIKFVSSLTSGWAASSTNAVNSAYIWGAQLENFATATEYLPTVTRLNFPRLDYTNSSCPSLLVEPQRTNLLLRSEELDNVIWSKTNATVTANSTTSPSGILNADKLVENTVNAQHYINQSFLNSNSLFTYSIYAKKGERDFLFINAFATIPNNFTYLPSAYFNLNNGTVGTVSNCNAFIQNVGNGWYRCIIQCTSIFPQTSLNVSFYNYIANTISNTTYLGDGTSGIFLWGAQVEAGSYATSYIPTVAASVTRNADIVSNNNLISKGLIVNDYTLLVDITNPILGTQYILDNLDISGNRTGIIRVEGTTAQITDIAGGSSLNMTNALTIGRAKMCVKRTGSVISFFTNGVKFASTTTTTAGTINNLRTGVNNSLTSSYINAIVLYSSSLTDAQCISLTTL
jgi:hypothetical protein